MAIAGVVRVVAVVCMVCVLLFLFSVVDCGLCSYSQFQCAVITVCLVWNNRR